MKTRLLLVLAALTLAACASPMVEPQMAGATYEITIVRHWSQVTNPLDWPGVAAHFTGGIGATHNNAYAMFGAGKIATPGLELLSQKGESTPFDQELAAAKTRGDVGTIFQYGAIRTVGGQSTVQVRATDAFSFVSFANMLAPSPDWFTGVPALALKRDGRWIEYDAVTLYAWDSGTNDARTYKAEKIAVNPFEPTTINTAPMFMQGGNRIPVGTASFKRVGG